MLCEVVPGAALPGREDLSAEEFADRGLAYVTGLRRLHAAEHRAGDRMVDLGGKKLAHHIIMVVRRSADDVNLRSEVRSISPFGPLEHLEVLDEIPPQAVQVLIGIAVEGDLEPEHDLAPAREDEEL